MFALELSKIFTNCFFFKKVKALVGIFDICVTDIITTLVIVHFSFLAGRRGNLSLSSILVFVTSTDEEPLLGFKIQPSIVFCEVAEGFLPTASTCVNSLTLPRPSSSVNLPETRALFKLYDLAFSNAYYGLQ